MKKFTNIILLSDMDGTLLNTQGFVSKENQEAVNYFVKNGGLFGIATGRSQLNALLFLDEIKVNAPSILFNGCGVYDFDKKKFIRLYELSKTKLITFLKHCLREFSDITIQIFCPELCYFVSPKSQADPYHVETHQPCEFCQIDDISELPWIKILFCGESQALNALNEQMVHQGLENELRWVFSSEIFLEYLPYGISKGSALQHIKESIGSGYKIYAVGDYNNDIEMLQAADVGIATQNAIISLKEVADRITVNNDENAIADIIYNIIEAGV
jgi:Cof subfamily protein (haloacid dehalogenase superfamily)